jgi:hypothetical protein
MAIQIIRDTFLTPPPPRPSMWHFTLKNDCFKGFSGLKAFQVSHWVKAKILVHFSKIIISLILMKF